MMGSRRGKGGNLKRSLDEKGRGSASGVNSGRGQEITGVTLPGQGKIRGWAFGEDRTIACANVDGEYLAVDGTCPRCGFDLFKGKLLTDADVWGPQPRVACPTCSTTYSLKTGKFGPEYKAKGLAGKFGPEYKAKGLAGKFGPEYKAKGLAGKFGPEYKAKGLAGKVNTWALTATVDNASKDVPAFVITRDEETGQVFCRER
eukprot:CAMPEP_0181129750 /NCGR_PEP_ID=MMETSP1071-20121207/29489_1 /TAXON_ID=35127 /ORGANISM="Thalassiosira sp., Strain NH16" /LENGTH=201 /DNA_ID=CAMNT_0023215759 /DNA_START=259 /DNA_END=864 /DNA_ORIENTATION=+